MKMKTFFFVIITCMHLSAASKTPTTLLIDTSGKIKHDYRNLLALLKSVGLEADYRNFFSFLNDTKIDQYETIFFILDPNAIRNLKNSHIQKCIKTIENFSKAGHKNVALLFPGNARSAFHKDKTLKLFECFGIPVSATSRPLLSSFIQIMAQHDSKKGHLYGTTLINKKNTQSAQQSIKINTMLDKRTQHIALTTLPRNQQFFSPLIQQTFPIALFVRNQQLDNNYLIGKISDFTFSEIAENFFANPLDFEIRQQRLSALQQTLHEFQLATVKGVMPRTFTSSPLKLPKKLTKKFNFAQKRIKEKALTKQLRHHKNYRWLIERPLSCALLYPGDYSLDERKPTSSLSQTEKETLKSKALQRGIEFIYHADLNLLWFEFNPESFLSNNALRKKDKQSFIQQVQTLGKALKKRFAQSKKPMPKIFIGTDITTNFSQTPVHIAVKDFFGKTYSKIPSPLDITHFWQPELMDVFDRFIDEFSQFIPIDGIFLDFEMYHAKKQAASYNNFMDFSDRAWQKYAQATNQPHLLELISVARRVDYLVHNAQLNHYFKILQQQAKLLGQKIKNHIRAKLPHILIGAYAPTLPGSWFYRGLYAGLSSKTEPLIFTSFNTDFYSHASWLEKQEIYLIHGAPILLSKLKTTQNFELINKLSMYHRFVWYNRPSRMIYLPEQRNNIWWSSEASPLPATLVAKKIQKHTKDREMMY